MLRATRRTEKFKKKEQINISSPVVSLFLIFSFYFLLLLPSRVLFPIAFSPACVDHRCLCPAAAGSATLTNAANGRPLVPSDG